MCPPVPHLGGCLFLVGYRHTRQCSFSLTPEFTSSSSFIHARKSNASYPHLFMSGNPMLQTLTLYHQPLTLTPNLTFNRRQIFFDFSYFLLFLSLTGSELHPHLFTLENPMLLILIYSRKRIQCFRPSFIHVKESNASNLNPRS